MIGYSIAAITKEEELQLFLAYMHEDSLGFTNDFSCLLSVLLFAREGVLPKFPRVIAPILLQVHRIEDQVARPYALDGRSVLLCAEGGQVPVLFLLDKGTKL